MDDRMRGEGGFVAGTLVHTDKGLVPIEQIQVGDMVLSNKENGLGEICYEPVIETFEFNNKEVWFLEVTNIAFHDLIAEMKNKIPYVNECFVVAPKSQFWVVGRLDQSFDYADGHEAVIFLKAGYWSRLDNLDIGTVVLLANGSHVAVSSIQSLFQMKDENRGFVKGYLSPTWDEQGFGNYVVFSDNGFVAYLDRASRGLNDKGKNAPVKRCKVFGIEIRGCQVYFVGKSGLCVNGSSN